MSYITIGGRYEIQKSETFWDDDLYVFERQVAIVWARIAFMATVFKKVDFPDAFEPVRRTHFPIEKSL